MYQDFPSKIFCLRMPKKFIGEPFCAVFQKTSGSEKFMDKRGGEYQDLPLIIFCLTVQKKIRRATILCSTEIPVSKNIMEERGEGVPGFPVEKFLSHSAEKVRRGLH